jgi:ElaB/YqjD/DUF883 family membrane-anchored ribosome-binding protein
MTTKIEADTQTLADEVRQLRADFARLGDTMRDLLDHTGAEVRQSATAAADAAWSKAKRTANTVVQEIDEKPVASSLVALGIGVVLGAILFSRR